MVKSEYAAEVRLLKNAVRDFEKAIRAAKQAFEAEDYYKKSAGKAHCVSCGSMSIYARSKKT